MLKAQWTSTSQGRQQSNEHTLVVREQRTTGGVEITQTQRIRLLYMRKA